MKNYLMLAFVSAISWTNAQNTVDLDLLPPVEDLMDQVTNPEADTVILCSNGGPVAELETDYFTFYHGISTFSTVYVEQYQQYNPSIMAEGDLTLEEGIICNDTGVAILRKVVNHFNDLGKVVVITGHSFGAFVIPEYLDDFGNEDIHRVIPMAGRINMTPEVWEAFATGYWAGFDADGTTVWVNDEMEEFSQLAGMKLMAGYGYNRHIDSLAALDLTNLMYLYGTNDEAVGSLTEDEVNFLEISNASVVTVEGGDHGSMFATSYMNQALDFIREPLTAAGLHDLAQGKSTFKAYPTVTSGELNIMVDHPGNLMIYSASGELVSQQYFKTGTYQLHMTDKNSGFYWLNYITDSGQKLQNKIILQ